ncbi:type II toxin-antitoxin system RatA family toxin [Magnetovibrio sp.]|uniref:type II toxin-antitoxin system RatA family toxin n=1 Tax=Magnetovibrio sp. TaxID=2024836 RepID=UPI002F937EA7
MQPIVLQRVVALSPDQLFAVAANIEAYPEFVPNCVATRIRQRTDDTWLVDNVFRWGPVPIRFRTRATMRPPREIDIRSIDSVLIDLSLKWRFVAYDGGTEVTFEMALDLPGPKLGLMEQSLRKQAEAFERAFLARAAQSSSVEK